MLSSSIGLSSSSLVESCTINFDLWHFRLGQIPNAKIQLINSSDSSIKAIHNKVCEICPLAKQKKLPFHISNSQSNKAFQLVHIDIWGPFSIPS